MTFRIGETSRYGLLSFFGRNGALEIVGFWII